jgi:phosphatidylserine/phosphatidylglycerophosphate/cardiolipin synthase-like enzyme
MESTKLSFFRSFWIGLVGFIAGGIASALATFIILRSGLPGLIINLIPEEQSFIRLVWGILIVFIAVGLGGAVGGLVRGYALHQIDRMGSQKRYLWGGAYSTWISQGILVVFVLLLIGLISLYNNGSLRDPASYIVFFAFVGGLFGLLNGAALAMITIRLRYAWMVWMGYLFASVLGGALFGVLVWRWESFASAVSRGWEGLLFLILAGVTIYGLPGGLLGLIYAWLSRKRTTEQPQAITPRHWQDIVTITIFTLLFLALASFVNQGTDFVTIYPGSTTTNLSNPTQGIHWLDSQVISTDIAPQEWTTLGLAAGPQVMAATWSNGSGEILLSYQQSTADGSTVWNVPINVSQDPKEPSRNPQLVLGTDGEAYIIWSDNGEIWYNHCQKSACGKPISLTIGTQSCATGSTTAQNDWPALALTEGGTLMVTWQADQGSVGFATWGSANNPNTRMQGCLATDLSSARPRLAASKPDEFWLLLSSSQDSPGNVSMVKFSQGIWEAPQTAGYGSSAEVFANQNGDLNAAWCGMSHQLEFLSGSSPLEVVPSTSCQNRPSIFTDQKNQIHLVYASDQWTDNYGNTRNGAALMETIRIPEGWSAPSIIGPLFSGVQQEAAGKKGSETQLAWIDAQDGNLALRYSTQPIYQCDVAALSDQMIAVLDVIQSGAFHPVDYKSPFCGNHFVGFVFMPNPAPEFYVLPPGDKTGYDQLADLLKKAQSEILFSNMQWDQDQDNLSPGSQMARTITAMYQQVKVNPEAFPRGMTIKILLGNYPSVSTLQNGDQIWNVVQDFVDAGLPTMEDPAIGWKVELANYKGSMPHSHTKFIVIDGKTVMAAGFNIAWTHLPEDNPSGKGESLTDLGVVLTGPVAQTGIAAFDDEWLDSNQLICNDLSNRDLEYLEKNCTWQLANVSHIPESLKFYLPGDSADAIAVYRTAVYKESDHAYEAALASAQKTIDIIHVNFTADLICDLNLLVPTLCNYDNTLPYLHSIVDAMEQNGVQVRVMVEGSAGNGAENLPNIQILYNEAEKRGLQDQLEVRKFNGRVHMKSAMIDDKLLFVGSQNFHYSSIDDTGGGVNEFVIATDSPEALAIYSDMFEYYWQQAIPMDEWQILGH